MGCGGMPPPSRGSLASRVQRTTLWWVGSPEATPRLNGAGEGEKAGADARAGRAPVARTSPVAVVPRNRRRLSVSIIVVASWAVPDVGTGHCHTPTFQDDHGPMTNAAQDGYGDVNRILSDPVPLTA